MPLLHNIGISNYISTTSETLEPADNKVYTDFTKRRSGSHTSLHKFAFLDLLHLVISCLPEAKVGRCRHVASNSKLGRCRHVASNSKLGQYRHVASNSKLGRCRHVASNSKLGQCRHVASKSKLGQCRHVANNSKLGQCRHVASNSKFGQCRHVASNSKCYSFSIFIARVIRFFGRKKIEQNI